MVMRVSGMNHPRRHRIGRERGKETPPRVPEALALLVQMLVEHLAPI